MHRQPDPAAAATILADLFARHGTRQDQLLPLLHALQDRLGYVPPEQVPAIAQHFNLSRAEVHGVITFYHDFRSTSPARCVVQLCRAEACQSMGLSVATVYGNLSPEVRRAQAERFREGQADIVVGTDAIAMGLNMPIQRIVMTTAVKYNGYEEEEISAALAKQIAGRAGRYGVHEEGFVAGYDDDTHEIMRALMKEKIPPVKASGFAVAPSIEQLHRISSVTGETSLVKLLKRFVHNIDVPDGFFYPRITEEQNERAEWLDTLDLSVAEKFTMSLVPISTKVPTLESAWTHWAQSLARKKVCKLQVQEQALFWQNLQEVEDTCRMYSAYAWLGYRMPEYFPSLELAQQLAREASERVDALLQQQNAAARKRQSKKERGRW